MIDFTKMLNTLKEHEEKHVVTYVTFPDKYHQRLDVLTSRGKELLANEGLLGTAKIKKLRTENQRLREALEKAESELDFFISGYATQDEPKEVAEAMFQIQKALAETEGE